MKGINNRQKMIVKPRESVQKYISQQKDIRKSVESERGLAAKRRDVQNKRP